MTHALVFTWVLMLGLFWSAVEVERKGDGKHAGTLMIGGILAMLFHGIILVWHWADSL